MSNSSAGEISLNQIIERKLSFLLNNDICPWDGDNSDLGERDALQQMLSDSNSLSEKVFEEKYLAEVARLSKRMEAKEYSEDDNDDYYESFSNTIVSIITLINPINLYDLEGE
ncbi:hypothetical protein [Alteromonas stellipolaris]|uniref:Uncharacterized protein n=1 Tax=Alteromonas stellipolaris TaxID=233316 RepID=A0AAW7YXY3_9ALTE|nr:hypothetical protein [Alteromonas stellipolaris]ANB20142.1 hypothetical protein A6K25_01895 [Alteromonas stellipolaris]MDO6576622.1 hypothetical protein [Alteromonas stellipolaris]